MALTRLQINNLRILRCVDIEPDQRVNFIYGPNGSGKTSILEAINILGMGRSFRSRKIKAVITSNSKNVTIFGRVNAHGPDIPVGVQRDLDGNSVYKVQGKNVSTAAELAEQLPIQLIDAHGFLLLEGSPKVRRQFIDWLVFHVKHDFYDNWRASQHCIKNRNSLLRHDKIDRSELSAWNTELIKLTEKITDSRREIIDAFVSHFNVLASDFLEVDDLTLRFYCGWDKKQDYKEILETSLDKDIRQGYTSYGPHRADLKIRVSGENAVERLSRGQQKLLVCAMHIAQGATFKALTGRRCVYLIDDLPAELDRSFRKRVAKWLNQMESQVFITGVEREELICSWSDFSDETKKVFHVEQGNVQTDDLVV